MFSEQAKHEDGVKRHYIENTQGRRIPFKQRIRLRNRGATLKCGNKHLDRKVEHCYPRGPAFLRVVDMLTVSELLHSE